jgi:hypothetical protein
MDNLMLVLAGFMTGMLAGGIITHWFRLLLEFLGISSSTSPTDALRGGSGFFRY